MPSILKANNLVKQYSKRAVVDGVSVSVKQGEIVGLLGPNGAGKTTTFYMITGMIKPNSGEILLDGDDISNEPMFKRARLGIGYLPQEASIFRKMSVYQNIYSVLEFMAMDKSEREDKANELMKEFGKFIVLVLRPDNIAMLSLIGGFGYKLFKLLIKKMDGQQNEIISKLDKRIDSLEVEILRLQILDGIESKRLSYSEVLYFFDKYKALGGNSFVEDKVEKYVYDLNKRRDK